MIKPCYVTYEQVKADLGSSGSVNDDLLWDRCVQAAALIDRLTRRRFSPWYEARPYNQPPTTQRLMLDEELLEIVALKTSHGTITIPDTDYYLLSGRTGGRTPYTRIQIKPGSSYRFTYTVDPYQSTSVEGFWGYHENYGSAWADTGQTVLNSGGIDAAATSITVTNAGARLPGTRQIAFLEQSLIRIEDELLFVDRRDATTEKLAVVRGLCGSAADAHDEGSAILRYMVMPEVERAALRLATWMYKQKDSHLFDTVGYPELGVVEVPASLPRDVRTLIDALKRTGL